MQLVIGKLQKTRDLNELTSEPAIRSCDFGQWIPCFDSCQLTIIQMSIVKLCWLQALTLVRKFDISHWFPYGADRQKKGHVITKISRINRAQNFLRYQTPIARTLRARGAPLNNKIYITFGFSWPLFLGMVMYDNESNLQLKQGTISLNQG